MISAKEAYDLSSPNLDKYRAFINKRISGAAFTGKLEIEIREDPFNMWLYGTADELAKTDACAAKVVRELRGLGYNLRQYYNESRFVDVALVISWEKQNNGNIIYYYYLIGFDEKSRAKQNNVV